tara:strand:+ start:67 stop:1518 length:1452 start_codon:yes stop_codon:yes gene_type:complete
MAAKLFGLEGSTVRRITKLFALDSSTPRRVKKLFSLDGSTVRLIFEDFSTFTISGTANQIVSPVNEIVDFGVRSDFNAGGSDVSVNASASGDASNVGGISGLSIDVDSSHTYSTTATSDVSTTAGVSMVYVGNAGNAPNYIPNSPNEWGTSESAWKSAIFGQYGNDGRTMANATGFRITVGGKVYGPGSYSSGSSAGEIGWTSGGTGQKCFMRYRYAGAQLTHWLVFGSYSQPSSITIPGFTYSASSTGRRARVVNGSNRNFAVSGGGLTAGGNFATGNLAAGASTAFITANSTNEAWTLTGTGLKNPATFTISNANNSIQVSGTFGDGENATQARDRIQSVLNANSTFQGKFNTGVDADKTISGVAHKVVTFTSDSPENTSDFSISVTGNDGSNTTPYEATTTQGATQSLQTTVQVTRAVEGSSVSSTKAISSQANIDTAGAEVATLGGDITYDSSTNKLKVQDVDATINVSNAGSLSFSKD